MKTVIPIIFGASVLVFVAIFISTSIPDTFKYGGVYFDKYPRWMDLVFALGLSVISMLAAFVSGAIVYSVLDSRRIRLWITNRLQRYLDHSRYKFNNVTDKSEPTIKY